MWIVLVCFVLVVAAVIAGSMKRKWSGGSGYQETQIPSIQAKRDVTYKGQSCGYRWTEVKRVSNKSL